MAAPARSRPMPETPPPARPPEEPAPVPVFGSWRAIHAAVALSALLVMALLALFSRWPF
jgi:anti-sigma-K factor RskA